MEINAHRAVDVTVSKHDGWTTAVGFHQAMGSATGTPNPSTPK